MRLVVLPIAEITAASDVFACKPLGAKLAAGACVARQRAAEPEERRAASPGQRAAMGPMGAFGVCRGCPAGEIVARRLNVIVARTPRRQEAPSRQASSRAASIELGPDRARHLAVALLALPGPRARVAASLGLSVTFVRWLEHGAVGRSVLRASVEKIASATGVTLEQLLAGQGPDGSPLANLDAPRPRPRGGARPTR